MLISKQWLSEFVKLPSDAQEIAKRLSLSTVEVEGVHDRGAELAHVVVGVVEKVEKHPNADKLKVCRVSVGGETVQIVCGGSNVREGMLTAVAKIGAKVRWHGQGEPVELKPAEIRGVKSEGMICGADEIGLSDMFPKKDEREIVDLSGMNAKAGAPLAQALGLSDVIFEIDHKSLSNRPDLWGHYGIARELAALYKKPLARYEPPAIPKGKGSLTVIVQDKKLCQRYMAVAVSGVAVAPSPAWMQERLRAVGIRPINNVVDITNYVMMELGQPMHAFDATGVAEKIVVRRAKDGEKIKALDGKEYQLKKDMLVIANAEKPLAIAGVMGGEVTGVTEKTTSIVFESATFDAVSVRKTSTALSLRSESSARFEKGLSPERAELGLCRAVELLLELCPKARIASAAVDKKSAKNPVRTLAFDFGIFEQSLGAALPFQTIKDILSRLGFSISRVGKNIRVMIPNWRSAKDISIPADVVEEVIRIYGYDKIPSGLPLASIAPPPLNAERALERKMKELLAYEAGFTEVSLYSFVSPEFLRRLGMRTEDCLELDNPVAKDRPLLRASMMPNLAQSVEQNLHRYDGVRLFEIGRVYRKENNGMQEETKIGLAFAAKHATTPFFPLAAVLRQLCSRLGMTVRFVKEPSPAAWMHPGRSAQIIVGDRTLGKIFELHPSAASRVGIDARAAFAELDAAGFLAATRPAQLYRPIPEYPWVSRDISFTLDKSATHDDIAKAMRDTSPLIVSVELFDVFQGGQTPPGKKSMAYHIVYQSKDKTLESGEADAVHKKTEDELRHRFGADIRH